MHEITASQQIDNIIHASKGWKREVLTTLRATIQQAVPTIVEEVKWKKPSKPEGVAVWSHNGNVCMADVLKDAVRLTFPKGAQVDDPQSMFNTRLDSKKVRAIDFYENTQIDKEALAAIVVDAVSLNA